MQVAADWKENNEDQPHKLDLQAKRILRTFEDLCGILQGLDDSKTIKHLHNSSKLAENAFLKICRVFKLSEEA